MSEPHPHFNAPGARFCERCGSRLERRQVEDRPRPVCPSCGWVVYVDPKVAAGVIVTLDGGVVLLKRGIEPSIGKWVFPGGYVDVGEPTDAAAAREAREEVGLEVAVDDLVGVYSYRGNRVVLVVYAGTVTGGSLEGNFETLEVRRIPPGDIPWDALAFESTAQALKDWLKRKDAGSVP